MWRCSDNVLAAVLIASSAVFLGGCETNAQTGALVGGAGGAGVGGLIGSMSHARAGEGALIGGAIGVVGGYMVGNEMDKAEQRKADAYGRPVSAPRQAVSQDQRVTKNDVINWTRQGIHDNVIIDRIERSGTVFRLTAADENQLRDAGVSEEVVRSMKNTVRGY